MMIRFVSLISALALSFAPQDDYLKRANNFFDSGDYQQAIKFYKAHHASVNASTYQSKIQQAEECTQLTILADNHFKASQFAEAEKEYAKILKINPKDPHATTRFNDCVSKRPVRSIWDEIYENMVSVPGGSFMMGSDDSEAYSDEKPSHRVTVSAYKISKYQVTQKIWQEVMGNEKNFSEFRGDDLPVINVSWNDALEFIQALNRRTGKAYRLPSEAEWEFAARGGNNSKNFIYSGSNYIDEIAWSAINSNNRVHQVGSIGKGNELGLFDMSGNVYEWCSDWYSAYTIATQTNPKGPSSGLLRVLRGGCWNRNSWYCRVSSRSGSTPDKRFNYVGFRLCIDK